MANGTVTTSGVGNQFSDNDSGGPLQDEINTAVGTPIAGLGRLPGAALSDPLGGTTTPAMDIEPETRNITVGSGDNQREIEVGVNQEVLSAPSDNLRQSTAAESFSRDFLGMEQANAQTDTQGGGGGSFGPEDTQDQDGVETRTVESGPFLPVGQGVRSPADTAATEPNVNREEDAGALSDATSTEMPPEARRQDDTRETLAKAEQQARSLLESLNAQADMDVSPQSRPVVETDEQRQMVEQADDPDTLRQRMDEVREQFNLPELEKRRQRIANQVEAEREAFNRTIQEVDDQDQIFGAMERRRLENLETQRDQRIQALSNLEDTITQQIDAINTRVNQEVQAEQVRDQREQEQAQQQRQRVGNLIETGALANMSDQEITSIAQESGYTPQTLARVRQAQRQSLQQVDASGEAGEFQDLKQLGAIGEDVTYQQFLQMTSDGGGGGAAQFQREFSSALQLAQNQITNMTRQQLINTINQQTTELNSGDIEDIVTQAEQQAGPELQERRFATQVQKSALREKRFGVTDPEEAANRVIEQYASDRGYEDVDEVPENMQRIITKLTERTYATSEQ